jgi:signal transduction histidine kinase
METIADTRKFADIFANLHLTSAKPAKTVPKAKKLNVLIIDAGGIDFEVLREHLRLVQRYNVNISRAYSFTDAAKFLERNPVELAVIGHSHAIYADDDALNIYAELKNEMPVLFMSAGASDDCMEADSVNYIDVDTLTPSLLEVTIRNALHIFAIEQKLEQTVVRLNEVQCAKDNFFAHVSHDLKTPLNAILGYSEALMLGAFGPLENANVADTLSVINRAGTNLLGAINELIVRVSSVDYLEKPLWEVADINEIIRTAIGQVDVFAGCRNQQINTRFDAALCLTECESNALAQAVTSVLTNAIKYSPEQSHISVSTRNCGRHVEIVICDQSVTLAGPSWKTASGRYGCFEQSADIAKQETCKGLSIVRSVVDLHHGQLELSGHADGGSMIKIILPRSRSKNQ